MTVHRMRRILIIANTYYQMIMAIQLNYTLFKDDQVTLLLSDHSKDTDIISERLKICNVFHEVHYVKTKDIWDISKLDMLVDFFRITLGKNTRFTACLDDVTDLYFDELLCFNYNIDTYSIYTVLYRYNKELKVSLYEEGVLAYGVKADTNIRRKIIKGARHALGKKDITEALDSFYCLYPSLYSGDLKTRGIPLIKNTDICSQVLKKIFQINPNDFQYTKKFIFFTSMCDVEGGDTSGEYQLVCKVADLVGKENLLVKIHPRDTRSIYKDNGFDVDEKSFVPWEAIQLSFDFSDKIYLTATSGSVLAGSLMSEKPVRTYYMYKCCNLNDNRLAQGGANNVYNLLNNEGMKPFLQSVSIVERVSDILD